MWSLIKEKRYWLYALITIVFLGIFSVAQIGARNSVELKKIPVAIVNESGDTASQNIEKSLKSKFKDDDSKIKWISVNDSKKLTKGFNDKKYYGAFIITKNFDKNLNEQQSYLKALVVSNKLLTAKQKSASQSLPQALNDQLNASQNVLKNTPNSAKFEIRINQGMNAQVAQALTTALPTIGNKIGSRLSQKEQLAISQQGVSLTQQQWQVINNPVSVATKQYNKIPNKSVSGMAPMLLVALSWFGAMLPAILLWRDHKKHSENNHFSISQINSQVISGLLMSIITSTTTYVLAHNVFGIPVPNATELILLLIFNSFVFYLFQTAILDWTGMSGWPVIIIVWLLSAGVMSYAPQMLGAFYRNWIYSWIPMRFSMQMINNSLYFTNGSSTMSSAVWVIAIIGVVALTLMYLSSLIKRQEKNAKSI